MDSIKYSISISTSIPIQNRQITLRVLIELFRYHEVVSKKLNACIGSSYAWFIFNLNTKQCYSQITHDSKHMHRYISIQQFFSQSSPLLPALALILPPFIWLNPSFYLLGEPVLLLVMRIPIHSCPWFAINCSPLATSPTPRHPTDQVTHLHRRHQQRQPFRLTQEFLNKNVYKISAVMLNSLQ